MTHKPLSDMTRAELQREYDKAQEAASEAGTAAIAAGFGMTKLSDLHAMDTPLGRQCRDTSARVVAACDERARRMRWQGNMHRIKPSRPKSPGRGADRHW